MPLDSKQDHHFYASTVAAWGTGTTREAAIKVALENSGSVVKRAKKGTYVWSVRVGLPQTAAYKIEYYKPVDVPLSEGGDGLYTLKRSKVVHLGKAE